MFPGDGFDRRCAAGRNSRNDTGAAAAATLLASLAVAHHSFSLLCVATTLIDMNMAFSLQYRFAATAFVVPERAGKAVGFVMVGTLFAAWLGPSLALASRHPFESRYSARAGIHAAAHAHELAQNRNVRIFPLAIEKSAQVLGDDFRGGAEDVVAVGRQVEHLDVAEPGTCAQARVPKMIFGAHEQHWLAH
jgi:hypothetical protein